MEAVAALPLTLTGQVLPVGGIREKLVAAHREGIKFVLIPEGNRKDLEEIKEVYIEGLIFHHVNTIQEVLDIALLKTKVDSPLLIE